MVAEKSFEKEYAELNEYISSLENTDGALITVLHKAQHIFGYLPKEVQQHIAHKLGVPTSTVYGVVTFYSFFSTTPKGKYRVNVCMGTACFVRNAGDVLEELKNELKIDVGQTGEDGMFSLDAVRCVGACGLAPVISINDKVYGRVKKDDVKGIVEELLANMQ